MESNVAAYLLDAIAQKSLTGKAGFRFLGGSDSNAIVEYLSGSQTLSLTALRVHELTLQAIDRMPVPVHFLVVPEAHVIYDDLLPDGVTISQARPVRMLDLRFPGRILYPEQQFRDLRRNGLAVYNGSDTHWSEPGAFAAYQILRQAAGLSHPFTPPHAPDPAFDLNDLTFQTQTEARNAYAEMMRQRTHRQKYEVYRNLVVNNGSIVISQNAAAPLARCIVFGTSFTRSKMLPCFSSDFREVVFCYSTTVDPLLVELLAPDHVFVEQPERFLPNPTSSISGRALLAHALMVDEAEQLAVPPLSPQIARFLAILGGLGADDLPEDRGHLAAQLAEVQMLNLPKTERNALRTILAGSFRRDDLMRYLNHFIDQGAFKGLSHLLPETEMGYLGRARLAVWANDWPAARDAVFQAAAGFGPSTESRYYEDYLRRR